MKWRIAVAGVATAIAFSGVAVVADAEDFDVEDFAVEDFAVEDFAVEVDVIVENPSATLVAAEVLRTIRVERENSRGYSRSLFKHWLDVDADGCDAREQVLKRDAIGFAQVDPFRCTVVEADWLSPYDGKKTSDRSEVDIDHVVALKEAWDSGAFAWNEAQRTAFANDTTDPRTLLAVSSSSNRSKSDKDPSNWLPPLRGYWCTYVSNWISVKARWNLSMDESEWGRINNLLTGQCAGTTMRGWSAPPVSVTASTTSVAPSQSGATSGSGSSGATSGSGSSAPALASVRPGAFCAPEGALGTYNSLIYVCSKTDVNGTPYSGNRARWRRQV